MIGRGLPVLFASCLLVVCSEGAIARVLAGETHAWSSISYPEVSCRFGNGKASPALGVSRRPGVKGLEFRLSFWWPKAAEENKGFVAPEGKLIRLRLNHADGSVVAPSQSNFADPFPRGSHMGRNWHGTFRCVFPWAGNRMEEAWLELVFPDQTYWLELPYGFTRDPDSTELPTSNLGPPKVAAGMKALPANAQIVNWKDVFYKVGAVKDEFWVSIQQSNLQNARSLINLGREVATLRWSLSSPRTSVAVRYKSGITLTGDARGGRLRESGYYRTDEFEFGTDQSDKDTRDWATVVVTVGDRQWSVTMPSSLYKHGHGVADPDHKATLR